MEGKRGNAIKRVIAIPANAGECEVTLPQQQQLRLQMQLPSSLNYSEP